MKRFALLLSLLAATACGGEVKGPAAGDLGGECLEGNLCDDGLECINTICVDLDNVIRCAPGQTECSTGCTDTNTDPFNCGGCDDGNGSNSCDAGEVCNGSGSCELECPDGLVECNGSCTDTDVDPFNCGGCDDGNGSNTCDPGEVCNGNGTCEFQCQGDLSECSGLCTNTDVDPFNCGGCEAGGGANTCDETEACIGGGCLPLDASDALVDGDFDNGLTSWTTQNNPNGSDDTDVVWDVNVDGIAFAGFSGGPAARVMFQDVTLPDTVAFAELSFDFFQDNAELLDPENVNAIEADPFDGNGDGFNQNAFRVDFIDPAEDVFTAPILLEVFAPTSAIGASDALEEQVFADPALLDFLKTRAGTTVRLRFGQVESTFPWQLGVDNVRLDLIAY